MIAHVQWPLGLPFPHVHLFYVDSACAVAARSTFSTRPPFLRYTSPHSWAPLIPILSFLRHGNVVTSYGSVICLYV